MKATKNSAPAKGLSAEEIRGLQGNLRVQLLEQLKTLDPNVVGELNLKVKAASDFFSDWHDRFNDNGHFTDGFGKAGGRVANLKTAIGPSAANKG